MVNNDYLMQPLKKILFLHKLIRIKYICIPTIFSYSVDITLRTNVSLVCSFFTVLRKHSSKIIVNCSACKPIDIQQTGVF